MKSNSDWLFSKTGKLQSSGSSWVKPYEKSSIQTRSLVPCVSFVIFMRGDPQPMALEWIKKQKQYKKVSPLRMVKGKRRTNSKARDLLCTKTERSLKDLACFKTHCFLQLKMYRFKTLLPTLHILYRDNEAAHDKYPYPGG